MRATAPDRLLHCASQAIGKQLRDRGAAAGVPPAFMPKRNSEPIRRRGPMGDDAALSRLANYGSLSSAPTNPAFVFARVFVC
jgi:hypothetical protein